MERNLRQEEWATIPFASLRPFRMTKISLHVILQIIDIWHFSTDCTFPQIWNENAKLYSPFAFVLEKKLGLEHSNVTRMEGDWHSPINWWLFGWVDIKLLLLWWFMAVTQDWSVMRDPWKCEKRQFFKTFRSAWLFCLVL